MGDGRRVGEVLGYVWGELGDVLRVCGSCVLRCVGDETGVVLEIC